MFLTVSAFIGGLAFIYYKTLDYPMFLPAVSLLPLLVFSLSLHHFSM
jgi:hypothetical protein